MKDNRFFYFIFLIVFLTFKSSLVSSEIIELSSCENNKDGFLKNEYILDLEKQTMTRNYVYNEKTYQKYRLTDLSTKKRNTLESFIYLEGENILTDKMGYPQFYTQLLFKKDTPDIYIKTVINGEEGVSKMSTCKNIERYKKES